MSRTGQDRYICNMAAKGDITRPDYTMYMWKKDSSGEITYVELNG
jgi:hypothetical protein